MESPHLNPRTFGQKSIFGRTDDAARHKMASRFWNNQIKFGHVMKTVLSKFQNLLINIKFLEWISLLKELALLYE